VAAPSQNFFLGRKPPWHRAEAQRASGPISRVLCAAHRIRACDGHSSRPAVAGRLKQPTRATIRRRIEGLLCQEAFRCPYSVLLPVGLAVPLMLPCARCALAAPFHPCLAAVCFLWRFPWGCPRRRLSGTVPPWSPDFPPLKASGGHPACWPMRHSLVPHIRQMRCLMRKGKPIRENISTLKPRFPA
jgi:hypothetical protein